MSAGTGCQLGNGVQHVFYIGFDNFHLRRDNSNSVANGGDQNDNTDTNIPSDLEQVPALYNFLRGTSNAPVSEDSSNWADGRNTTYSDGAAYSGGTLLTNEHTPLISHTSVDFTSEYTGVYGDRNGIATSQNSEAAYTNALTSGDDNLPVGFSSGFAYWTDPVNTSFIPGDNTDVFVTQGQNGAVNPPAPWEPFTEAGCDVGAVSATAFVLENASSVADESTSSVKFTTADEGLAVHCANPVVDPNTICTLSGTDSNVKSVPDTVTGDPSYTGYSAIFGHKFIAPAINDRLDNQSSGGSQTLALLPGRPSTSSFPGFNGEDGNYTLGYTLDMQKAGIPVTFGYLSDAHDCHSALTADYGDPNPPAGDSPCNYTDAPGTSDPLFRGAPSAQSFGSGEAGYESYLSHLNSDFQSFFDQAKADGFTTANTEFVFYSDENDHVSEGTPANPTCDGVTTPCEWNHSGANGSTEETSTPGNPVPGQLGESFVDLDSTLPSESQYANQPYFINPDSAPEIYLENGTGPSPQLGTPAQTAPNVRQFERDLSNATYTDPYTGSPTHVVNQAADHTELSALHMVTADPLRTPTEVAFSPGADFVNSVPAANAFNSSTSTKLSDPTTNAFNGCNAISTTPVPSACSESTFTYVHGDFAPETNDTWAGLVGPGVLNLGSYGGVWTDHVDIRATLLDLVGLHDSYMPDGRVITQIIDPNDTADPENTPALHSNDATQLGTMLKKINAPVYESSEGAKDGFGTATLDADTAALASGTSSGDSLYATVESDIATITAQRNAVVADIQARLMAAELNNVTPSATTDVSEGTCVLDYAIALDHYARSGGSSPVPNSCIFSAPSGSVTCANAAYSNVTIPGNVTVPSGDSCTLIGTTVNGNVQVQSGGRLWDQGATVQGNIQANRADWVAVGSGGTVNGNVQITGTTGAPPSGYAGSKATPPQNYLCSTVVRGNVVVQGNGAGAPFEIGGGPDCDNGLSISGNLQVQSNSAELTIGGAPNPTAGQYSDVAQGNIQVQNNTGGVSTLTDNHAGGNCQLGNDQPGIAGQGNSAGGHNTCNQTA
jgi:hypothetical protein